MTLLSLGRDACNYVHYNKASMMNQRSDCIHRQCGEPMSSVSVSKHGSMVPYRLAVSYTTKKSHLSRSDSLPNTVLPPVSGTLWDCLQLEQQCVWLVCGCSQWSPPSGREEQQDMCLQLLWFEMAEALASPESKVQNSLIVFTRWVGGGSSVGFWWLRFIYL